jgi:membrane protein implicated in regulation of membrane protease activity
MLGLARFWRWWTDTWRAPRRARWLYVMMAMAFAAIALVAVLADDAPVAAVAGFAALVTVALAAVAPWLSRRTDPPDEGQEV